MSDICLAVVKRLQPQPKPSTSVLQYAINSRQSRWGTSHSRDTQRPTKQQPMASTVDKTRGAPPLLSASTGFVFAFRVSLTFLWFQDKPQPGTIVWLALSVILLSLEAVMKL